MRVIQLMLLVSFMLLSCSQDSKYTLVSIVGNQFYINGELTYKGRYWKDKKIEGLLFNSRMVQGIFDDLNPETRNNFAYPDTKVWDADRNTNEFIANMEEWRKRGLLAFTLNLQGGSPLGYGNKGWINSLFDKKGELRLDYLKRLERILNRADELNMVVILGYFYFGQDQNLQNEEAVVRATDNMTNWILTKGYGNILVEINNECNIEYDHEILQTDRVPELIQRVQAKTLDGRRLLVATSFGGGTIPSLEIAELSDYILIHGNGVKDSWRMREFIQSTRALVSDAKPIVINEDDHFNFESDSCNFITAVNEYVSWGYFDFRMKGEGYEAGYQSVPVDWGISSDRKKAFFKRLEEITID